jgi:hypothetical protein
MGEILGVFVLPYSRDPRRDYMTFCSRGTVIDFDFGHSKRTKPA